MTQNSIVTTDLLAAVREAAARIHDAIYYTPCPYSAKLSKATGQQIYLKLENLQMTGAFKERGALNKILLLSAEERERGVIAASAGNHAQAVAIASRHVGAEATIVMPEDAPKAKL